MTATREVIEFAESHGGVITRSEALALGMAPTTLSRRVNDRVLIRVRGGVFALPGTTDHHRANLEAACRKLGAVVSHQSAAFFLALHRPRFVKPTVSVAIRRTKEFSGVTVHQLTDLTDEQIRPVLGLPMTTPERTVIDMAAVWPENRLARLVDTGLASGVIDLQMLSDQFEILARKGKPGTKKVRHILDMREGQYVPPESELESRLLEIIDRSGLPRPTAQFQPNWLRPSNGRVDFAYQEHKLIIECDGRRWHSKLHSFEVDRLRDNAAQLAGWRILRFTWTEVTENPDRVVRTIDRAFKD